ncbi:MAG: metallophosphoesterase [SAR324 cluster bacterium]|nr:metallophosphoesterase [SAR324 cluster bacterium]
MDARRTICVGDVHGCYQELMMLLKKVGYSQEQDQLIFVGDLVNRGPESLKVLEFVRKENAQVVMGNHEYGFLLFLDQGKFSDSGFETLRLDMGPDLEDWTNWIRKWPLWLEWQKYLVVHAGLVPGQAPAETKPNILMNIRTWDGAGDCLDHPDHPPWFRLYRGISTVIYGHWAKRGLELRERTIGLDSGCVYGNRLSALILPERKIIQVNALKKYVRY